MTIERYQNDKDVNEVGERFLACLMTARDFDLNNKATVGWLIKSFYLQLMLEVTKNKDLNETSRAETRAIVYAFASTLDRVIVESGLMPQQENLMLDYMAQNGDKLIEECVTQINDKTQIGGFPGDKTMAS